MPLWQPAGPNGFADTQAAWATPESMKLRLDVAAQLAQRAKDVENPLSVLDSIAGPEASTETRDAVSRAESASRRSQSFSCRLNSRGGDHGFARKNSYALAPRAARHGGLLALSAFSRRPPARAAAAIRASSSLSCVARLTGCRGSSRRRPRLRGFAWCHRFAAGR